ncbi:hypothetical protein Poli38472_001308 [Pythium oligandrum]|uniref:HSF-type DNA-binding domain-containing protein n=1 Tax=Pythium oligandrum TaxID=41045 RepID=A0A8K1FRM5_PYTOL|nr:hypothetical protein Poli38472_001308 [Pythium oligandrum]|eukprot:TMW69152.1 hypothetical protein Poli38472_001308 [Pythium oligandrum]
MRGADAFQHHLYYVLDDAHEPRCLQWDPQSRSQFVWHGDNHGLIEYLQVKRGRFGVSLEASFRKKLLLLGFVVCGHRSDCHPGHECVVYRYTDENAFFRGMHGELETPQAMTITPDAAYTHDIAVVERFLATFPWCSLDDEELEELTTYLAQEDPLVLSPLGDVPLTTLPPMSPCSSPEMQGIGADLGDLCF